MTQHTNIKHITSLRRIEEDRFVRLDKFTIRSLELLQGMNEEGLSLLGVIDKTITAMGARMLKRWMVFPLKEIKPINDRLNIVEHLKNNMQLKEEIEENLHLIGDLERIISKAAVGRISPREVVQLKVALKAIEPIKLACRNSENESLQHLADQLNVCATIRDRIEKEIVDDPPLLTNKGGIIKEGIDAELDELRRQGMQRIARRDSVGILARKERPRINEKRELVKTNMEKAEVPNNFFVSVFTATRALHVFHFPEPEG